MELQQAHKTDFELLRALQPAEWPDITPALLFYKDSSFCFTLKAADSDGSIAGTGTLIVHNDVAWLAHIIVHPHYRRRGLGRQLTEALVEHAYARHCSTIYLIATDLGAPVYEKTGFVTETEYLFFKDVQLADDNPPSPLVLPYAAAYYNELAALDRLVSGEDRMEHTGSLLEGACLYRCKGITEAAYLPAFGEGLIMATTAAAGLALLQLRLRQKDFAVFPEENTAAADWLCNAGFSVSRRAKRMRLGKERHWQPQGVYNRIGGNLG